MWLPAFEQMKKEGEAGRRKITQYTRYGTLGWLCFSPWALRLRWSRLLDW
jgi:preprotein translocase subunit SecY